MRGRFQAVMVVAICGALVGWLGASEDIRLASFTPLANYLGAAAIVLATLRKGLVEGLVLVIAASMAAGLQVAVMSGGPVHGLVQPVSLWICGWGLALVLRRTASQGRALEAAGLAGVLAILAGHMASGSVEVWDREIEEFERLFVPVLEQYGVTVTPETAKVIVESMAATSAGVTLAVGGMLSLFLGRWWQAILYNPGGFGTEFRALRVDRRVASAVLIISLTALLAGNTVGTFPGEVTLLAIALFVIQGLAVVHATVSGRGASLVWLVVLYVALILFWPFNVYVLLLLSIVGFVDAFVDWRARLGIK